MLHDKPITSRFAAISKTAGVHLHYVTRYLPARHRFLSICATVVVSLLVIEMYLTKNYDFLDDPNSTGVKIGHQPLRNAAQEDCLVRVNLAKTTESPPGNGQEYNTCITLLENVAEKDICSGATNGRKLNFLVYIHTAVVNWRKRKFIRKNWGSLANQRRFRFRVVFFIGVDRKTRWSFLPARWSAAMEHRNKRLLREEITEHGDIVQASFVDSYRNMTLKALTAMNWIRKYCRQVEYIVKLDDDVHLNVPRLLEKIPTYFSPKSTDSNPGPLGLTCSVASKNIAMRDRSLKWFVTPQEYSGEFYPEYCYGYAYVLHIDTLLLLNEVALRTVPTFWIDDVFITGIIRQVAGLAIRNISDEYKVVSFRPSIYTGSAYYEKTIFNLVHRTTEI
ncbi:beta-1,3-galactosyltransferase 5-like [Tubulanus polymorphus]|uniref:beta-1,3-galactosyltransferase 5-like n=1 Tax=Tubulanus polymorphus TaxID=672921 RepID=UPI003DA26B59